MADIKQLESALIKADAAGNADDARALAAEIRRMRAAPAVEEAPKETSLAQGAANLGMGVARGVKDVIDTGAQMLSSGFDKIAGTKEGERVRGLNEAGNKDFAQNYGDSTAASVGRVGGNVLATLPVGGVIGQGVKLGARAAGVGQAAQPLVNAIGSAGFKSGAATPVGNALARTAGGAITGGASAGLVNPDDALTGAAIGGALPGVLGGAAKVGQAIGKGVRGGEVAPEVASLAQRAKDLGIDIPADRIVDSKPMNALASSLNYVPFSGRAATEAKMQSQMNKALSRTFGQDSDNVTGALRKAGSALGGEFDRVLKGNVVKVDDQLLQDLAGLEQTALSELSPDGARIIKNQIDQLIEKGATGEIDGQAAYNIKRTLDKISKRNSPEGSYAGDVRASLMDALNRSLGPEEAVKFAKTRSEYGNMRTLEKLAQNGAEGDISIGRLANLKNVRSKELQELADIAAQFLKTRESPHGAMQRVTLGTGLGVGTGAMFGLPALAGGVAAGRGANALLNSNAARNFVMSAPNPTGNTNALLGTGFYRSAPLLGADQ